ncbi:cellulase family glycosylhydrolase [Christensenellaceae bacterium OttesenSCG-928-K19]|nr:cellulase family glycosylhydrolase [Christensenellaceae bacterium OttesenSCG-928-K19]
MKLRNMVWLVCLALVVCLIVVGCDASLQPQQQTAQPIQAEQATQTEIPPQGTPAVEEPIGQSEPEELQRNEEGEGYFGSLSVEGGALTDGNGSVVQLKGVSSHGLSWFPQFVNEDAMRQMKEEWGCNVFRLAMYTEEYNGYCSGDEANRETLKELIDTAVRAAEELKLYIIIDWHILSDNNPLLHKDEAVAFFREMAEKYSDKDHVIYEICNEPNGDTSWEDIREYAEEVIPVIREHTEAVVLVGTPTWSQDIDRAVENPLTGYDNIMYTLHFYAATHKEELRSKMAEAALAGLPVFVSEFGICDASGNGAVDEAEADLWLERINEYNISYVMWNFSNKDESSAMITATSTKTSGFIADDLSQAGKWFVGRMGGELPQVVDEEEGQTDKTDDAVRAVLANSWESNGGVAYQYVATVQNNTDGELSTWKLRLVFNQDIELQDGWNGEYNITGDTLTITPMEYNAVVAQGGAVSDIGFILESAPGLELLEAVME